MPVLPKEPSLSPDALLSPDYQQQVRGAWWALHTRPRAEKSLARRLLRHDIAFFLPLHERSRRMQRRNWGSIYGSQTLATIDGAPVRLAAANSSNSAATQVSVLVSRNRSLLARTAVLVSSGIRS